MNPTNVHPETATFIERVYTNVIHSKLKDPGLFSGNSGLLLFLNEYYKIHKTDECYEKIASSIPSVFEGIKSADSLSLSTGIAGIAWTLNYLEEEGVLKLMLLFLIPLMHLL